MLKLTTTESYSLILEAFADKPSAHEPLCAEANDPQFVNKAGRWSGYIHGQAQDKAGFDIPHFFDGELPAEEGEFPCELHIDNSGKPIACTLIQWKPQEGHWNVRALICANDDEEGLKYARLAAENKFASL